MSGPKGGLLGVGAASAAIRLTRNHRRWYAPQAVRQPVSVKWSRARDVRIPFGFRLDV